MSYKACCSYLFTFVVPCSFFYEALQIQSKNLIIICGVLKYSSSHKAYPQRKTKKPWKGQNWKTMDHGNVDGMIMSSSPKQTYGSLQYSNMPLDLVSMSLEKIHQVSLKGFRKRGATHHKMMTIFSSGFVT